MSLVLQKTTDMTWLDGILKAASRNQAILFQASLIEFRMMSLGMVGKDKRHCVWGFRRLKTSHRQGD